MIDIIDIIMDEKFQSDSTDPSLRRKNDSDSIVRGILSNSIKYNHEKQSGLKTKNFLLLFFLFSSQGDSSLTPDRISNGNGNNIPNGNIRSSTTSQFQGNQSKV